MATDLGYLLVKNRARVQAFPPAGGTAHVFYPEAAPERCTAALLLDIEPVALMRGRQCAQRDSGLLDQYVNDRPYVASSFMYLCLGFSSKAEIGTCYAKLAEGGQVDQPLNEELFGMFGELTDRFGRRWMLQFAPAPQA